MADWTGAARRWIGRYGPPEIVGTAGALIGYAVTSAATGSPIAAAYGGSLAENLGFYGTFILRLMARERLQGGAVAGEQASRRFWDGARQAGKGAIVEFGPAELLDTLVVRPLAMGVAANAFGPQAGVAVGKLAADAIFFSVTILGYELRRHARPGG